MADMLAGRKIINGLAHGIGAAAGAIKVSSHYITLHYNLALLELAS